MVTAAVLRRQRGPQSCYGPLSDTVRGAPTRLGLDSVLICPLLFCFYHQISADFYEGIRAATQQDVEGISALLQPLMDTGVVLQRTQEELLEEIPNFTIVEREAKVIACVLLKDLGVNSQGQSCVELAAFCVDPQYRSGGRGDSLLDYGMRR